MRQSRRFNLKDVVRHLHGRDASLRWMYTSHGVPLKESADRRGKNLTITITQGQRSQCIRRSHDETIVVDVGRVGEE